MKGFFVSISKDGKNIFVYDLKYTVTDENAVTEGTWAPTILVDKETCCELIQTPGYPLSIEKLDNDYFKKFCQTTKISCNGWLQGKMSPYLVTRYKNDRMFLLLAEDMSTYPVDINHQSLFRALKRSNVSLDGKIFFMNDQNQEQSSMLFSSLETTYGNKIARDSDHQKQI